MTESELRLEKLLKTELSNFKETLCREVRNELRTAFKKSETEPVSTVTEPVRQCRRSATSASRTWGTQKSTAFRPSLSEGSRGSEVAPKRRPERAISLVRSFKATEFALEKGFQKVGSARSSTRRFGSERSTATTSIRSVGGLQGSDVDEIVAVNTLRNSRTTDSLRMAGKEINQTPDAPTDNVCLPGVLESSLEVANSLGTAGTGSSISHRMSARPDRSSDCRMFTSREVPNFDLQVEKAMGLAPPHTMFFDDELRGKLHGMVSKLVLHRHYTSAIWFFILFNAIMIGAQSDYLAKNERDESPLFYRVFEILFGIAFATDVLLRIYVHGGGQFFHGHGWAFHLLDFVLSVIYISQELVRIACSSGVVDEGSFLRRCLVVSRSIQIVRILHLVRASGDLRLLFWCLAKTLRTFFWAMALVGVMTYIMCIILTDVTADARGAHDLDPVGKQMLLDGFGSVPKTLLSLFQSISGGVDWDSLARPLVDSVSTIWGVWFSIYIAIMVFALLNVITGLFVQTALAQADRLHEQQKMAEAWKVFQDIDKESSGAITRDDMDKQLGLAHVLAYFKSIDLDPSELHTLFNIIDSDHSGSVDFEEFLHGCLRFQGTAKSADVLLIMMEIRAITDILIAAPWYEEYVASLNPVTPGQVEPLTLRAEESETSNVAPYAEYIRAEGCDD